MKVLMIATEFPPIIGGGGRYVENLIKGLSEQDVQVQLLTSGETDEELSVNKNLKIKRYRLFRDLYFGRGNFIEGVNEIIKYIELDKPDLIHSHHSIESLMVQVANLNYSIPHIITHHKTPEYRGEKYKLNGKWSVFKFVNQLSDRNYFIAASSAFVNSLIDSGINETRIFQVYPGVDQSIYKKIDDSEILGKMEKRLGVDNNDILVLIPAQIRQRKGIEFALQSLSKLSFDGKKIKVLITGTSLAPVEMVNKLKKALLPNELIKIDSPFEDKEMPSLYSIADVVVLPSEAEGLGMCLLEAMACQTPIVGTNVMGINEVLTDNLNGKVVEFGDKKGLSKAVVEMLKNSVLREKCVQNGLLLLQNKFNLRHQADKHIETYRKVIGQDANSYNRRVLTVSDIQKILNSIGIYKKILENKSTIAFMLIGSIPGGKYIPGWSDIDLICLANRPDINFLNYISGLEKELQNTTGVKTGIEVVDYQNLKLATKNPLMAENFVKYMKNFYRHVDNQKIIFLRDGYELPVFSKKVVAKTSLVTHSLQTLAYMNKFLKEKDTYKNRKDSLRKIIKNTLFIMQGYLLVKEGLFTDDYEAVIQVYSKSHPGLDCRILSVYFSNRIFWRDMKEENIKKEEITSLWRLFQSVAQQNISASN